jgi:hypothetical protein
MAIPHIKKIQGRDFNFYQKVEVNWSQFGASDGYTTADGYGPDLCITFPTQSVMFLNEETGSTSVVEYSFNGTTVHGELDPSLPSRGLSWDNRVISLIWFRVKAGSTGPVTVRVDAWGIR